jgi:hypothetical protein
MKNFIALFIITISSSVFPLDRGTYKKVCQKEIIENCKKTKEDEIKCLIDLSRVKPGVLSSNCINHLSEVNEEAIKKSRDLIELCSPYLKPCEGLPEGTIKSKCRDDIYKAGKFEGKCKIEYEARLRKK